jgi:hypothetical protein
VIRDLAGLWLSLVVHDEDSELGRRGRGALLGGEGGEVLVDILLQLSDGIAEGGPRVVDLILLGGGANSVS